MKKNFWILLMMGMLVLFLAACGGSDDDPTGGDNGNGSEVEDEPKDPITLQMAVNWPEDMFNERIKDHIEEKFEHITMEFLHVDTHNIVSLEEAFAAGHNPDFFFSMNQPDIERFELDYDLEDLFEEHGVEMKTDTMDPAFIDAIRAQNEERRFLQWPYESSYTIILYNKEIFDRLGVPYPSDDLTWDDLLDLAEELTQEVDGTQFRGLDIREGYGLLMSPFQVNATDPETGEVLITEKEEFQRLMAFHERYQDLIPTDNMETSLYGDDRMFDTNRQTAMMVTNAQAIQWWFSDIDNLPLDYDVAAVPVWPEVPDYAPRGYIHSITVNPYGDHVEDVLHILNYLASDEYQDWMARKGIGIVSTTVDLQENYFYEVESSRTRNIPAIFARPLAPAPEQISTWDRFVDLDLNGFYESGASVNEWLRIVAEEAEVKIAEYKVTNP